jgi:hypothetical protein
VRFKFHLALAKKKFEDLKGHLFSIQLEVKQRHLVSEQ